MKLKKKLGKKIVRTETSSICRQHDWLIVDVTFTHANLIAFTNTTLPTLFVV